MYYMPVKSVRFPDDLAVSVQARADELERSFSWVVVRVLEQARNDWAAQKGPQCSPSYAAPTSMPGGEREHSSTAEGLSVSPQPSPRVPEKMPRKPKPPFTSEDAPPAASPSSLFFRCPIARCEFTAKSPAAKCGAHGRTVVPV